MDMTRKDFLKLSAAVAGGAILAACGGTDPSPTGAPHEANCQASGTQASIASNHGHTLTVSSADVTAGVERTYDITGSSGHSHMVTVSAAAFASLQRNQSAMALSTSGGGHTHSVVITCV